MRNKYQILTNVILIIIIAFYHFNTERRQQIKNKKIVLEYWEVMNTNDFITASKLLSEDYECHWPQTSKIINGRDNFVQVNSKYLAEKDWKFKINLILVKNNKVVTFGYISDEKIHFKTFTIFIIENGLIKKQVEYLL